MHVGQGMITIGGMSIYAHRIELVRKSLAEWDADALLIMSPYNRRWLTGFVGSAGEVAISRHHADLCVDGRYWAKARQEAPTYTIYEKNRDKDALEQFILAFANKSRISRIAIEPAHVTLEMYHRLDQIENIEWVAPEWGVERWRGMKSSSEIRAIRRAAAITDKAMAQVSQIARPGMSERALAWELEKRLRELGADGMSFEVLVASGEEAAKPHHTASDRRLAIGDPIIVDMGAQLNGFNSDLTRTFFLGNEPSERFRSVYNTVYSAHKACLDNMKAGMTGAEIDSLARNVIEAAGFGNEFKHSTGHSVGLEVHETPTLRETETGTEIPAGAVVTIEPGIYIDGWSGVRIEDLVVVTQNGAELLSHCPKKPLIPVDV